MSPTEILRPIRRADGRYVVGCSDRFAAVAGTDRAGTELLCGHCRQFAVGQHLAHGQVWGLGFRCPACRLLSVAEERPPGTGLCVEHTKVLRPQEEVTRETVEIGAWGVLADVESVEAYVRETGSFSLKWSVFGPATPDHVNPATGLGARLVRPPPLVLNSTRESVLGLVDRARRVFGPTFGRVVGKINLHGADEATGASGDHPLSRWVHGSVHLADSFGRVEVPTINPLIDLAYAVEMAERWQSNPRFRAILRELHEPRQFRHNLAVLCAAGYLADQGGGVSIPSPSTAGKRTPDLRVCCGPTAYMTAEVKAPESLDDPREPISVDRARSIVRARIDEAGLNEGGQLSNADGSILILAGYDLRPEDLNSMVTGADMTLKEADVSASRLAAVVMINRNVELGSGALRYGPGARIPAGVSIKPMFQPRKVTNRRFTGRVALMGDSAN